ncbi:tetratricopeptide repeat protein [Clostridium botulinum]|nr:tetratricopeptide repeat protein [Clostridium botulinum]
MECKNIEDNNEKIIDPKAKEYKNKGNEFFSKKDYDNAIEYYNRAISLDSSYLHAYYNKGLAYANKKDYDNAIKLFSKAIEIDDKFDATYNAKGVMYYILKEYSNAIENYTAAIDINPNFIFAYNNRANAYKAIGELDKAKDDEIIAKTLKEFNDYVQSMDFDKKTQKNIKDLLLSVSELKKSFLNTSPKLVGHYTKLSTLKFLIKPDKLNDEKETNTTDQTKNTKPCLRLNNVSYMNDPSEGTVFLELLKQINDDVKGLVDDLYETGNIGSRQKLTGKNTFLVSLSKNIDTSLPMWTQYTDDGQGACLVFNPEFFDCKDDGAIMMKCENAEYSEIQDNNDFKECYCLYKVQYMKWNDDKQKYELNDTLKESLNVICDKLIALNITEHKNKNERGKLKAATQNLLDQVRFLFKDDIYAYEAEERIIKSESNLKKVKFTGDNENFVVPHTYIEIDKPLMIDEVILGPKVKNPTEAANYIYFSDKNILVSKSRIKYQ